MEDYRTQPTLETIVDMLKAMQLQMGNIQTQVGNIQTQVGDLTERVGRIEGDVTEIKADVSAIKDDLTIIKAEQFRQAQQIDKMAREMHGFASDLYDLRLEFRESRKAS